MVSNPTPPPAFHLRPHLTNTKKRTLIHPASVLALGLTPPYLAMCNATTTLFARCFGAQAMTCGLVLGTAENLGERGFRAFALAMVPYLVAFNFWFSAWGPRKGMVTSLIWLDFVGNVGFLGGSWYCAKLLGEERREREANEKKGK